MTLFIQPPVCRSWLRNIAPRALQCTSSSTLIFTRKATVCLHAFIPICAVRFAADMVIFMRIALFGNYSIAGRIAALLKKEHDLLCLCNPVDDDGKYGPGIQQFAKENKIGIVIGDAVSHLQNLEQFHPDFILSAAYKNRLLIDKLPVPAYGIHLGGIYGEDAIRGKNSVFWCRLNCFSRLKVSLYRYTSNEFDVGDVIREESFFLSDKLEENVLRQLDCIEKLVRFMSAAHFELDGIQQIAQGEPLGSYYPKAPRSINSCYLSENEVSLLRKSGVETVHHTGIVQYESELPDHNGTVYCYSAEDKREGARDVLFLHGFASRIPNDKIKKLAALLDGGKIYTVALKGISRIYCDGGQRYADVARQMRALLQFVDLNNTVVVCSSVSALLLCDHIETLRYSKSVVMVTPIFSLRDTPFDDAIARAVEYGLEEAYLEFDNPYYAGCKMNRELFEVLKGKSVLRSWETAKELSRKTHIILAQNDPYISAGRWRTLCIERGIASLNHINIVRGAHAFADIWQLCYLASTIKSC